MQRTTTITAAAIAGVVLAGTAAIAANIGILTAADDKGQLGAMTAMEPAPSTEPQVVDVYLDDLESTTPPEPVLATLDSAPGSQDFLVDDAGLVSIVQTSDGIRLSGVAANPGWTWKLSQESSAVLRVTFTDGRRTLELSAMGGPDGPIAAAVDEIILTTSPPSGGASTPGTGTASAPSSSTPGSGTLPSGHDDDDDRDDDHEDDDEDRDDDDRDDDDHEDEDDDHDDGRDDDD